MLLGKRPRPPIRRTTSMTEFAPVDLDAMIMDAVDAPQPSDPSSHQPQQEIDWLSRGHVASSAGVLSPRNSYRRSSGDFRGMEMAPFLKACGLCKRRLGPGRDIYMYRGEVAFCSLECRQQLITQEERKEKRALSSIKIGTQPAAAGPEASGNTGETVAAA